MNNTTFITVMLVLLAGFSFFLGVNYCKQFQSDNYKQDYIPRYEVLSSEKDAEIINYIAHQCRKFDNLLMRMTCVNQYVKQDYNYVVHGDGMIWGANKLFNSGGMCVDYTNFYFEIAKKYGYTYNEGLVVDHIFAIVSDNDYYCNLDMTLIKCYTKG